MPTHPPLPRHLPLVQYWDASPWPLEIAGLITSFTARNPDHPHLIFDRLEAETLIAEQFSVRELAAFRSCAVPAMRADYFRLCALHALGGAYIDADACCVGSLHSLLSDLEGGHVFQLSSGVVQTGIFAFRPGHPFLRLALEIATVNIEKRIADVPKGVWITTGPGVFTAMYRLFSRGSIRAFLDLYSGTRLKEEVARVVCEAAGDYAGIVRSFHDVRISPIACAGRYIRAPEARLAYKHTDAHWNTWRGSIFTEADKGVHRYPTTRMPAR